jgi:BlaI family penicillinase repressor
MLERTMDMTNKILLSDGEWKLMKLLWRYAPLTLRALVEGVSKETEWSKATVFMMLKRLVEKGAVALDDTRKPQTYYPILSRRDAAVAETGTFLARVYDGSVGLMVSSLSSRHLLTMGDITEIRKILDRTEEALLKEESENAR